MSYSDIYSLAIPYRKWFIDRLVEDAERSEQARKRQSGTVELKRPENIESKKFF